MTVTNYYGIDGEILGEKSTGGSRIDYLTDALGSVTATLNQSAQVVNTYRYKPYGSQLAMTGSGTNPTFMWLGSIEFCHTTDPFADEYIPEGTYSSALGQWSTNESITESWLGGDSGNDRRSFWFSPPYVNPHNQPLPPGTFPSFPSPIQSNPGTHYPGGGNGPVIIIGNPEPAPRPLPRVPTLPINITPPPPTAPPSLPVIPPNTGHPKAPVPGDNEGWCGLHYGNCCGPIKASPCKDDGTPGTDRPKKTGNPGKDCIDRACCRHDCCIGTIWDYLNWPNKVMCDLKLCFQADDCLSKCETFHCKVIAIQVGAFMCALNTTPPLNFFP